MQDSLINHEQSSRNDASTDKTTALAMLEAARLSESVQHTA
jgi:hypothetical protein